FQDWCVARAEARGKKKAQKELDRRSGEQRRSDDRLSEDRRNEAWRFAMSGQAALLQRAQTSGDGGQRLANGSEARAAAAAGARGAAQDFERTFADAEPVGPGQLVTQPAHGTAADGTNASAIEAEPAVNARADLAVRRKTVMPKIAAGGYKLPPSSLLH